MIKLDSIVNSVFNSVTYLITDTDTATLAIVDCGDAKPIIEFAHNNKLTLIHIFLTHTHYDHIYGLDKVLDAFPSAMVYTNAEGRDSLIDPKFNLSRYHVESNPFILKHDLSCVRLIDEGSIITFVSSVFQVIATPGHDPGCLAFCLGQLLFTGDSYLPGIRVTATWPRSNKKDAKASEERLKEMEREGLVVKCGHKY